MDNNNGSAETKHLPGFKGLIDNNKFVFVMSLIVAFFIWVGVAMYASPDESYVVNDIPIVIDINNEIIKDSEFEIFNQSADKFNVTVTGPRYLVTRLTPDDFTVNVPLNNVTGAGLYTLNVRASLTNQSGDIAISTQSLSTIQVYFDNSAEKTFSINVNDSDFAEHVAEGFRYDGFTLPVTEIVASGPATQIEKIIRCSGTVEFGSNILRSSDRLPLTLGFEGKTAAETVAINNYVKIDNTDSYYAYINVSQLKTLDAVVELTGTPTSEPEINVTPSEVQVYVDTANEAAMEIAAIYITSLTYTGVVNGPNIFTVQGSNIDLPEGVTLADPDMVFTVNIKTADASGSE